MEPNTEEIFSERTNHVLHFIHKRNKKMESAESRPTLNFDTPPSEGSVLFPNYNAGHPLLSCVRNIDGNCKILNEDG